MTILPDQHVRSLFLCDQAALMGGRRGHPTPHGYILLAGYTDEMWGLVTTYSTHAEGHARSMPPSHFLL
jgi:hypothetical protein